MYVSFINGVVPAKLGARFARLGVPIQPLKPTEVKPISSSALDEVYLIPFSGLERLDAWANLRVKLARGARHYVVCGEGLTSAQIMMAARDGAHDVLEDKDDDGRWQQALASAARSQDLWWQLYGGKSVIGDEVLSGRSPAMQAVRESVERVGPTRATVLISGESGVGKERVAEAIHLASGQTPLIPVNCAAIPSDLMESELFGAEKGAFTGADKAKPGLVEAAEGGILFLDEIGELDIGLQPKLLRFLESRKARRVGSNREYPCNVRVIAATNRDLQREAERGQFRLDLYYRLAEVVLPVAPLRQRQDDVPDLAELFLHDACRRLGKNFDTIEPELIASFQTYAWPGNARELRQTIERMAIHYNGPVMRAAWWRPPAASPVEPETVASASVITPTRSSAGGLLPSGGGRPHRREKYQRARVLLAESGDDLTWVAAQLGIHPTTLYRWRKDGKV